MSEEQKAAVAELTLEGALKKAVGELEGSEIFKKWETSKQNFERARVVAEVNALYTNNSRTGVGTRVKVGATRGKNPQVISYVVFDDSQPDTLPKSYEQFVEVIKPSDVEFLDYLIRGKNDASYEAASDPLAEYVVASWKDDVQLTFRTAVRNYSKGLGIPLEDAVGIIRPGFVAKFGE